MDCLVSRREVIAGGLTILAAAGLAPALGATVSAADPQPFDFQSLQEQARRLARVPFSPPSKRAADVLSNIDFDAHQRIRFRKEKALWAEAPGRFPVQMFHLGRYFQAPVALHVVEDGVAHRIVYSSDFFSIPSNHPATRLPRDLGFAGFRVMVPGEDRDWLSFLGASYFRSAGELDQYGLSARGIAINTGGLLAEEFPRFTAFWLEQRAGAANELVIYALLDGPSVTGAYRFVCTKTAGVVMDVKTNLYVRNDIAKMGIAPLTSMFWYSEANRQQGADWRPEVHDSDGLALWTGTGERIWRPLNNPSRVQTSTFLDSHPKGFGLLQRDRLFHNYEDDSTFYDRRPSVWVEPLGSWGDGRVELVEIPTDDEIYDNIVAYWVPKESVRRGSAHEYDYRLHWLADEPYPAKVAKVVATRIGRGGIPGQPRPPGVRKFMIDFTGGELHQLGKEDNVRVVVTTSRGRIDNSYVLPIVGTNGWRASFDLHVDGSEAVDLRCYLDRNGASLSETWLSQYVPFRYSGEPEQTPL